MSEQAVVLIVDDEEICLAITSEMVKKVGLPVLTARDGIEALSLYQQHGHEIGCVLMDIQMPRMDGIETFRHLKKLCEDVQVVITSGYLNSANQELLEPLNPAGYLKKPISFKNLSAMLMKCLSPAELLSREAEPANSPGPAADGGPNR